ncbi:MAG: hypothetical protein P4L83_08310 [Nevskia sp.]|nr:hypothetical protein [Nevskia sp.]
MKKPKRIDSVVVAVARSLLAEFANAGHIDLTKPKEDIWKQLRSVTASLPDDFDVVIDHTPKLLAAARRARSEGQAELSLVLYATWVEHSLNLVIKQLA